MRRVHSAGVMNAYPSSASSGGVGLPLSSASNAAGGSSLMPHRRPDFTEGSILEEKDSRTQRTVTRYRLGGLLGQGGFAKCYEVKDLETGEHLALKVCERQKLIQTKTLGKLQTEIAIHRRMNHKNIVRFYRTFQDEWNIYIVLELCRGTTLMDLSKSRKRFTPQETQHVMNQTLQACQYMHQNNVIHRDLKLGNMMMDENMNVKIGDFGLAAELLYDGERKRTICGTPNYIAPEILAAGRDGHSFEVDTWSVGVILYTLLVGEPPFQTSNVKNTYSRIKHCQYDFPIGVEVPQDARDLIHRILQSKPENRPTLMDIRGHYFFNNCPKEAPLSLYPSRLRADKEARMMKTSREQQPQSNPTDLLKKPVQQQTQQQQQPPLSGREALRPIYNGVAGNFPVSSQQQNQQQQPVSSRFATTSSANEVPPRPYSGAPPVPMTRRSSSSSASEQQQQQQVRSSSRGAGGYSSSAEPLSSRQGSSSSEDINNNNQQQQQAKNYKMDKEERDHFAAAHEELHRTLIVENNNNNNNNNNNDAAAADLAPTEYPDCPPPSVWVTQYADFSNRYGLAYRLSTGHTGCHFNDNTKLIWEHTTNRAEYYSREKTIVNGQPVVADKCEPMMMEGKPDTKKTTLIRYFKSYINAGGKKDSAEVVRCSPVVVGSSSSTTAPQNHQQQNNNNDMVYVKRWMITSEAMVFRLSNRVIQVCFFSDKSEVILASESRIVTFSDRSGNRRTMPLAAVNAEGGELARKLMLTKDILSRLIANRDI